MSLSDLASLGSFVSGFAVLVSLVYLALQVRQAEKNQRALIHQGRTAQVNDRILRMADPALRRAYLRVAFGREPLAEEVDFHVYTLQTASIFREMQDVYFQRDLGLLDDAGLNNHVGLLRNMLSTAVGKAAWRMVKEIYDPNFVARVDAIDRSEPVRPENFPLDRFRAELAKIVTAAP